MDKSRSGPRIWFCLAGLLLLAGTLRAAQHDRVTLCEGAPDCDGADVRFQSDIPSNGNLGFSVAMGYLDSDRFADIVMGAPNAASVYVFYGGPDNPSPDEDSTDRGLDISAADLVLTGNPPSQLGYSVAVAPRQLIIGAPASNDDNSPGAAYVIRASFLSTRPTGNHDVGEVASVVLNGALAGDEAGYSVALGPVLAGDDVDDIVVGARRANGERGEVYVVDGASGDTVVDLESDADVTVTGAVAEEGLGEFLAVADFEPATSSWEIAVGAVGTSGSADLPGRVYLLALMTNDDVDLALNPGWRIEGNEEDFFGFSLAAGEFDTNPGSDLAVGAVYADRDAFSCPPEDRSEENSGAVYLFSSVFLRNLLLTPQGASSQADNRAAAVYWGDGAWDELGFGLAAADVDADGADDLIASARRHDRNYEVDQVDEGAVYIFPGPLFVAGVRLDRCLDCVGDDCTTGGWPPGVSAMLFGGDYDITSQTSDEVGFSVAAGDFNEDSVFDDIAVSSVTHERVYLVSLENSDSATGLNPDGQATDDYRDIRDRDDDGDGYADTDEDADSDGVLDPAESDPYLPNRDVTVSVDPQGDLACGGTIPVEVTVTNSGPQLSLSDPRLRVELPTAVQAASSRSVFEYVEQSTTINGTGIGDLAQKKCQNDPETDCTDENQCASVGGACSAFPFLREPGEYRSLTESGIDPLPASGQIVVRFLLRAVVPLESGTPTGDDIVAEVEPVLDELPYEHATAGLSQPNDDSGTVTLLLPDLEGIKTSSGIGGDPSVIDYQIAVTNGGTATREATGAEVEDPIPARTAFVPDSATVTYPGGAVVPIPNPAPGNPLLADVGTIGIGESVTVDFRVEVDPHASAAIPIENQATIREDCLEDSMTNVTSDEIPEDSVIVVSAGADRSTAQVGDVIDYTYDVTTGSGNAPLSQVTVEDDLCGPRPRDSGDTNGDDILDCDCTGGSAETWTYSCAYTVTAGDPIGPLVNSVTAEGKPPHGPRVNDTDSTTVTIVNTPPAAADDAAATDTDTAVAILVLANDVDANGHTLTITGAQDPTGQGGSAVINDNGTPGTPADDFIDYGPPAGFNGIDSFDYTIEDGFGGSDTATVTVTVSPPPAPGAGSDPSFAGFEGDWIVWSPSPQAIGYHLYRGDLAVLRSGGAYTQDPVTTAFAEKVCWFPGTQYEETFAPPAGSAVFYLVTADDGLGEGSLGSDSEGEIRPNDHSCR